MRADGRCKVPGCDQWRSLVHETGHCFYHAKCKLGLMSLGDRAGSQVRQALGLHIRMVPTPKLRGISSDQVLTDEVLELDKLLGSLV